MTGILAFGLPVLLIGLEEAARRVHTGLHACVHAALVAVLGTVLAIEGFSRVADIPGVALIVIALAIGVAAALGLRRLEPLRQAFVLLAPAPLLFAGLFLFGTPVRDLILDPPDPRAGLPEVSAETPVVVLVFDEFNGAWLADDTGRIDAGRYPNLAALAEDGIWFRNATTVSGFTEQAVPAILTGRAPVPSTRPAPTYASHPKNLFTLLGGTYRLEALESITSLCPKALCALSRREPPLRRLESLARDLSVVFLHVALVPELTRDLPTVTAAWGDFAVEEGYGKDERTTPAAKLAEWMERIRGAEGRRLFFAHVILPHAPWRYLPSGRMYEGRGDAGHIEGLDQVSGLWAEDDWLATQAFQRYLLQVGMVDRAVGQLVERLRSEGLYERALLVVTADHGVSFRPGEYRRVVTPSNAADIMPIPLIIKAPGGARGVVSDRNVRSIDILPTIADLLDVGLPWPVDGVSAVDPGTPEPSEKVVVHLGGEPPLVFGRSVPGIAASIARAHRLFGNGRDTTALYRVGRYAALVGRSVNGVARTDLVDLAVELDWPDAYATVDTAGLEVPANVKGWLVGVPPAGEHVHLAVAINGRFEAVTRTAGWVRGRARFSAMVPESVFRDGHNEVAVFVLSGSPASPRISPTLGGGPRTYALVTGPDGERIVRSDGMVFRIRPGVAAGRADLQPRDGGLAVTGWAVDLAHERPAASVLVFVGGQFRLATGTGRYRPDVSRRYGTAALDDSGFGSHVPGALLAEVRQRGLRVFAILADGTVGELATGATVR